jgi:hypothetical protein
MSAPAKLVLVLSAIGAACALAAGPPALRSCRSAAAPSARADAGARERAGATQLAHALRDIRPTGLQPFPSGGAGGCWRVAGFQRVTEFLIFLRGFQQLVARRDRDAIAALVEYPIRGVRDAEQFRREFDTLFNPTVCAAVANQDLRYVHRNSQGAHLGRGELWFREFAGGRFRIVAINH